MKWNPTSKLTDQTSHTKLVVIQNQNQFYVINNERQLSFIYVLKNGAVIFLNATKYHSK